MDDKTMLKELVKMRKALEGIEKIVRYMFISSGTQNSEQLAEREEKSNDAD